MGQPPAPKPGGMVTHVDESAFREGVHEAEQKLRAGKVKNHVLLYIAEHGEQATLHDVWRKVIAGSQQEQNLAMYRLPWPSP